MRNGVYPQTQQAQLNQAIEQVRGMMQQIKTAQNPEAALAQMLQNNPNTAAIANLLHSNNLENIAQNMARNYNIDINWLINQLQGGI